ncbi:PucR family transcriptional regulator [Nocardia blacklockiae]|uniref:PucR family transcriptional regulator n=1 Tax=Nocardia blacklockiae TaxID=480036 RepID=UPI002B4AC200|nr:helix-turn-helix domain-containing protein [Nocardia blacklockiae]
MLPSPGRARCRFDAGAAVRVRESEVLGGLRSCGGCGRVGCDRSAGRGAAERDSVTVDDDATEPAGHDGAGVFTSAGEDVWSVSRRIVAHLVERVVPCGALPGEALRGEVSTVIRLCLQLAVRSFDGRESPGTLVRLEQAAARWAREGIALEVIQQALHEGFRVAAGFLRTRASAATGTGGDLMLGQSAVLERLTVTFTRAYVRELQSVLTGEHTPERIVTRALLGGQVDSTMARQCGVDVAEVYHVVAVAIPPHPEEQVPGVDGAVVARRKLRRVEAELTARCGDAALSLLSVSGGTVLVPVTVMPETELCGLVESLSVAAQVPITATTLCAPAGEIPAVAHETHEVLDTIHNLRRAPRMYLFAEVALEHQITRPGPALDSLRAVLEPLESHPELLQTLACHLAHNRNRQQTARAMHLHTNTVDYRLRRVAQLTGIDLSDPTGLWRLCSALVACHYTGEDTGTRCVFPVVPFGPAGLV